MFPFISPLWIENPDTLVQETTSATPAIPFDLVIEIY
jgi:hypothetical protein